MLLVWRRGGGAVWQRHVHRAESGLSPQRPGLHLSGLAEQTEPASSVFYRTQPVKERKSTLELQRR